MGQILTSLISHANHSMDMIVQSKAAILIGREAAKMHRNLPTFHPVLKVASVTLAIFCAIRFVMSNRQTIHKLNERVLHVERQNTNLNAIVKHAAHIDEVEDKDDLGSVDPQAKKPSEASKEKDIQIVDLEKELNKQQMDNDGLQKEVISLFKYINELKKFYVGVLKQKSENLITETSKLKDDLQVARHTNEHYKYLVIQQPWSVTYQPKITQVEQEVSRLSGIVDVQAKKLKHSKEEAKNGRQNRENKIKKLEGCLQGLQQSKDELNDELRLAQKHNKELSQENTTLIDANFWAELKITNLNQEIAHYKSLFDREVLAHSDTLQKCNALEQEVELKKSQSSVKESRIAAQLKQLENVKENFNNKLAQLEEEKETLLNEIAELKLREQEDENKVEILREAYLSNVKCLKATYEQKINQLVTKNQKLESDMQALALKTDILSQFYKHYKTVSDLLQG